MYFQWDQLGIVYYNLNKDSKVILQHDNIRPRVANVIKTYEKTAD